MKSLRLYQTVTLATAFSLLGAVLAGCGGQQNQPSGSPSSGQQVGGVPKEPPIAILALQAPWEPAFQKLVDRYQQQTENQVSVNVTPFNGMLQKSLNAVQSPQSEFDVLILNEQWYAQFDADKMVTPIQQIDPNFTLDPQGIEYQYATRWNEKLGASTKDGQLYGLPINGNIQLFYYRKDLFDQKGLSAPKTWDDVEKAAQTLNDPPTLNGFAIRPNPPGFEFQSILYSYGGEIVHLDEETGQWSVEINKPQALQALQMWLTLGKEYGPKNIASIGQPELIGLLGGGKLAQAGIVAAAVSDLGDPQKSIAAGKIQAVPVPVGPRFSMAQSPVFG
ncbi:MAG: extracellular solute-binding protein [Firmicutes bacterium]|nr:extracellular solute-binding protein [Bacillota bacterium]